MDEAEFEEDYIRGKLDRETIPGDVVQERICPGCGYHSNHATSDLFCADRLRIITAFAWDCSECGYQGMMIFDIYH